MDMGILMSGLSPLARMGAASAPIVIALVLRLLVGNRQGIEVILLGSATWLAMNVVMLAA